MTQRMKMPKTMAQIRAGLGPHNSRKGLCNSPHPDPKYLTPAQKYDAESETWTEAMAPTVRCSRFDGHNGDCAAYAYLISRPDRWPKPDQPGQDLAEAGTNGPQDTP